MPARSVRKEPCATTQVSTFTTQQLAASSPPVSHSIVRHFTLCTFSYVAYAHFLVNLLVHLHLLLCAAVLCHVGIAIPCIEYGYWRDPAAQLLDDDFGDFSKYGVYRCEVHDVCYGESIDRSAKLTYCFKEISA